MADWFHHVHMGDDNPAGAWRVVMGKESAIPLYETDDETKAEGIAEFLNYCSNAHADGATIDTQFEDAVVKCSVSVVLNLAKFTLPESN